MPALPDGTVLKQRYKIEHFLGQGSFGETYKASDLKGNARSNSCVVKRLQPSQTDPFSMEEARRLFYREADVLKESIHDRIPRFIDFFEASLEGIEEWFIVYNWIPGTPLSDEIKPNHPCSEGRVLEVVQEILEILHFIHRNQVIHRDVKPANLIVRQPDRKIVLIDFGTVKYLSQPSAPKRTLVSTHGYAPFEQQNGFSHESNDLYALGMTAIEMLTGESPHQLRDTTGIVRWRDRAKVKNEELAKILDKMVHRLYSERYHSAKEVIHDLNALDRRPPRVEISQSWRMDNFQLSWIMGDFQLPPFQMPQQISKRLAIGGGTALLLLLALILPRLPFLSPLRTCQKYLQQDRPQDAPQSCLNNVQLQPEFVKAFNSQGDTSDDLEEFEKARNAYQQASRIEPDSPTYLVGQANALYRLNQFDKGDKLYQEATQKAPSSALEWNSRGDAAFVLDRLEEAKAYYSKALDLESRNPKFNIDLGAVLYKLNRDELALKAYGTALELSQEDSDKFNAWMGTGKALFGLKRYEEALEAFDRAQNIEPDNPEPWFYQGLTEDKLERVAAAKNRYETVLTKSEQKLKKNQNNLEIISLKAQALAKLKKETEAQSILETLIKDHPKYFTAQVNYASVLWSLKRHDDAIAAIDAALKIVPEWKQHELLTTKGSFLADRPGKDKFQNFKKAIEAYTEALNLKPDFVEALQGRGQAYASLKQWEEALKDFDKAVQADNQNAKNWILRGAVLAEMGQNEEALASIERGLELDDTDAVAWLQKGTVLEKRNQNQDALEAYDRSLELNPKFQQAIEAHKKLQEKLDNPTPKPSPDEKPPEPVPPSPNSGDVQSINPPEDSSQ
jgi:eukaryotic-like serine/threonine-protein kinase